ncbi:transporter substrate-binding domain-containing protein [Rhizobium miluonense]|uniref:Polar amino acid transport system substrate-binding protein n=1 Tax=Rhizobium miluonense TaxID=411945 RepID=A0A1C3WZR0_9HYPH|nr:transporter substrate-binding domain-containing protein [Rhizobium miluonense]SCB45497.1 polar amino acid transport system substrate-binding protein [Rhizobium miluonense]
MIYKSFLSQHLKRSACAAIFAVAASVSAYAGALTDKVKNDGVIVVGINNSAPSGYVDADGNIAGIFPEVLKSAATPLGLKKIEFQSMDFAALIPSLMAHRIDAIAGGMYILPKRCEQVIFANPFFTGGAAAVVKQGNPKAVHSYEDLAKNGVIVGNLRSAASIGDLIAAGVKQDNMPLFQDETSGISALMAGRVDALILPYDAAIKQVKDPNVKGVEIAAPFKRIVNGEERVNYGSIVFRPDDADFRDRFNETLTKTMKDGTVQTILEKYNYPREMMPSESVTAKTVCGPAYR